jgi:hypothetical protein
MLGEPCGDCYVKKVWFGVVTAGRVMVVFDRRLAGTLSGRWCVCWAGADMNMNAFTF